MFNVYTQEGKDKDKGMTRGVRQNASFCLQTSTDVLCIAYARFAVAFALFNSALYHALEEKQQQMSVDRMGIT